MGYAGDWGSHTFDLAWNVIDAELPKSVKTKSSEEPHPDVTPENLHASFIMPANDWRDEIRVSWIQNKEAVKAPREWMDLSKLPHGALFKGDQGYIIADFNTRTVIPFGKNADMSYYRPRSRDEVAPDLDNFQHEWTRACKNGKPEATSCNFEYGANMIETLCTGLAGFRSGEDFQYNAARGVASSAAANQYLTKPYRKGWTLNG